MCIDNIVVCSDIIVKLMFFYFPIIPYIIMLTISYLPTCPFTFILFYLLLMGSLKISVLVAEKVATIVKIDVTVVIVPAL